MGHPSLASDVIEEFRAPVVESLVLRLVNTRAVTRADFVTRPAGGCFLTDQGRIKFLRSFERKMATLVRHSHSGFRVPYRRCIDLQVQDLRRHILGEIADYRPMVIR
jgi:CRISPR-associated protein Cas1